MVDDEKIRSISKWKESAAEKIFMHMTESKISILNGLLNLRKYQIHLVENGDKI